MNNLLGDWFALVVQIGFFWFAFGWMENMSYNKFEKYLEGSCWSRCFVHRYPDPVPEKELIMDEDVRAEKLRVKYCKKNSVCVDGFRKVYSVPFSKPILAVENVSFAVDDSECFALLGVNGAGKSTTFKSLTNVIEPTNGEINMLGFSLHRDFSDIRYRIGYCPQEQALFSRITVLEHLNYYFVLKGLPEMLRTRLIRVVINKLGLNDHKYKTTETLSGGNKRKLQTAIAILGNPLIILLDEPSAGMDPAAKRFMWNLVSNITKDRPKSCVILTTHSMEEADALSTKMGIMVQGGLFKCFGTSQHIKDKFGAGYETEFKLKNISQQQLD